MISKAQLKRIRALHLKKNREEEGLFIAEGPKVVNDLLGSSYRAKMVFSVDTMTVPAGVTLNISSEDELGEISALSAPNRVLAVFETKKNQPDPPDQTGKLILALDDIRDPGNMGTIIRIADWFGISAVLCSESCVDVYNPKVVQATMGSLARVNVFYVESKKIVPRYKQVYGTVMKGKNIYTEKLSEEGVILLGNESRGISEDLLKLVTDKLSIPNFSSGADSLNAAVASAIVCSEFKRRNKDNN